MILVDASVWRAVLENKIDGLPQYFLDLWHQEAITSPPIIFAQSLTDFDDDISVKKLRGWAMEAPPVHCGTLAWVAAGDLGRRLLESRIRLTVADHLLIALALREDAPIWSLNPIYDDICRLLPVRIFVPQGIRL